MNNRITCSRTALEDVKSRFMKMCGALSLSADDVASLYSVELRESAQAVKNNPSIC